MFQDKRLLNTAGLVLLLALLIAITSCKTHQDRRTPEAARAELQRRDIDYSPETFLKNATDGNTDAVNIFLDAGMNPNVVDKEGDTALMAAAGKDHAETVRVLLARGADVHAKDSDNNTALAIAALVGSPESIKILLAGGADVNARGNHGTPLILASFTGRYECVAILLEKGADIKAQDEDGHTGLMLLARYTKDSATHGEEKVFASYLGIDPIKTARLLLDKGADVNLKDKKGKTALMIAEEQGNVQIAELLKQAESAK